MTFPELLTQGKAILNHPTDSNDDKLQKLCTLLRTEVAHYDWVGFYFKNGSKHELKLGVFAGEPTDHVIIPFGKGICGQVAESNSTLNVSDVESSGNYLACGLNVKSELVVPLFVNGENVGQIDIDSHQLDAFSKEDEKFLEEINTAVARVLG